MDQRPNPDELLKQVQAEDASASRGRLKLFFGASPGVGKTYAMLEAARQRKKEGWDVVVGLVETHGRAETQALLDGLEILPRKEIVYRGVALHEFDLDAALTRRPRLLIIDELAHTNAEGLRHHKRWQDVEEVLDAGIDVYTTLNVQHWESLNDVVAQITGVSVQEKVPDTFLQRTHDLELVDLAPEDLLQRLKDGRVYKGDLAGRAMESFFKAGNLIALRELALRHAAERVDAQMQAFKARNAIEDIWHIGERLMVGVSSSPMSELLVRATSRLATRMKAPWIAVNVETTGVRSRGKADRDQVAQTLRLAAQLGAETVTLYSDDITGELIRYGHTRNVTHLILGKPARPRWKEWLFGSIINDVARRSGSINLHVINGTSEEVKQSTLRSEAQPYHDRSRIMPAFLVAALATLVCWPLASLLDRVNLVMIYLLGVVLVSYRYGRTAAFVSSVVSVAAFDFFFIPPKLTFAVADTQYLLTFGIMLGVGLFIGTMMGRLRSQTSALRDRVERMRVLYKLSHDLSETPDTPSMFRTAQHQISEFLKIPVIVLTAAADGHLRIEAGEPQEFFWNDNEKSVARWVLDHDQPAGVTTDTLAGATGLYIPMKGLRSTVGVFGVKPADPHMFLDPDHMQLLESFAAEIGGAVDSTRMSEEIGRNEVQLERQAIDQPRTDSSTRLGDLLSTDQIVLLDKERPQEEIIRLLLSKLKIGNRKAALKAILEREKAGATLIGSDVAIPHARVDGLNGIQAALAVVKQGPIKAWVLFLSPASDPKVHLAFLAGLAEFFRRQETVFNLSASTSIQDVLSYIRKQESG